MNKAIILQTVRCKITEKIENLENLIFQTRESNNETKSSMGDKYETGREMIQQEINNLQVQLQDYLKAANILQSLTSNPNHIAASGSLVETDRGFFYIAVSLGEINLDNKKIFVISSESPLAKALHGKRTGQKFILNASEQTILKIW